MTHRTPAYRRHHALAAITGLALACAAGAAQAQVLSPIMNHPQYGATVYAFGEGGTGGTIYQDIPPGSGGAYDNHHSMANPAGYSIDGYATRYFGGLSNVATFAQHAQSKTSTDNNGTIDLYVSSQAYAASSRASIRYWFAVLGPAVDSVMLTISGYASAEANSIEAGYADAGAEFQVNYRDAAGALQQENRQFANHQSGTFSTTINVRPNVTGSIASYITLSAFTWVGSNDCGVTLTYAGCGGAGGAYIDPVFSFADPAQAALYTVVGWDGRVLSSTPPTGPGGGTGAVPEPGAWALMITGFGLLGGQLRRRRTVAVAA